MSEITFDPADLLWRTKGRSWDYAFVAKPDVTSDVSWWSVFGDAFPDSETVPALAEGTLPTEPPRPFVAAILADPEARDEASRPILHYLVWVPNSGARDGAGLARSLPGDWPLQVLARVRPYHIPTLGDDVPARLGPRLREAVAAAPLQEAPPEEHRHVDLTPPKKDRPTGPPPTRRRLPRAAPWILGLVLLLAALAVLSRCGTTAETTETEGQTQQ